MNATLLPSDMKSEVERFAKKGNVNFQENTIQPTTPLLFDTYPRIGRAGSETQNIF